METPSSEFSQRIEELKAKCNDPTTGLDADGLLDAIWALCVDLSQPELKKDKNANLFLKKYQRYRDLISQSRVKKSDFDPIKSIGQGAFGKVQLVRHRETGQVFAMKSLSKPETIKQLEVSYFWEEREIMATANSDWIVRLFYAFQDSRYLYFVMEFMQGGNLDYFIANYEITVQIARFYVAEVVLAIDALHGIGFIHRDIKPGNMLFDSYGHLKLADFGTCMRVNEGGYAIGAVVGTPDYISPETLQDPSERVRYGRECDWWAVGILLYEMLYGAPPFEDETLPKTYGKIIRHKITLQFPKDNPTGNEKELSIANSLISNFLTSKEQRLGRNGAVEVKAHTFFATTEWTWENIRETAPPFVPELTGDTDTAHFEEESLTKKEETPDTFQSSSGTFSGNQLPFIGFTFNSAHKLLQQASRNDVAEPQMQVNVDLQLKVQQLTNENDRLRGVEKNLHSELEASRLDVNQLQANYRKECENRPKTEQQIRQLQSQLSEQVTARQDSATKLEQLKAELREVHQVADMAASLREQVSDLSQQLKSKDSDIDKLQRQVHQLQEEAQTAELDRSRLKELLYSESDEKAKALRQIKELAGSKDSLTGELVQLQQREEELKRMLSQARAELIDAQKEAGKSKVDMEALHARISELERRPRAPSQPASPPPKATQSVDPAVLFELQTHLDAEIAAHRAAVEQLIASQRQISELTIDKKSLAEEIQMKTTEGERLLKELDTMRTCFEALQGELQAVKREREDGNRHAETFRRKIEEGIETLKKASAEKQRVTEELSEYQTQLREIEKKLNSTERLLDAKTMFGKMLKSQQKQLLQELALHKTRCEELAAENSNILADYQSLADATEKQRTERQTADLRLQRDRLIEELKSEHARYDVAVTEWSAKLADGNAALLGEITRLFKQQYEDMKKEMRKSGHAIKKVAAKQQEPFALGVTLGPEKPPAAVDFQSHYLRKKQECQKLEMQLGEAKRQRDDDVRQISEERSDVQSRLHRESKKCRDLEAEVRSKEATITELLRLLKPDDGTATSNNDFMLQGVRPGHPNWEITTQQVEESIREANISPALSDNTELEIILSVSQGGSGKKNKNNRWQPAAAVLKTDQLVFYNAPRTEGAEPVRVIVLEQLCQVRKVALGDCRADDKDIPNIYQIKYCSPSSQARLTGENDDENGLTCKGHQLVKLPRPRSGNPEPGLCGCCHSAFVPVNSSVQFCPVVQCMACNLKFHKEHVDNNEEAMPLCKIQANDGVVVEDLFVKIEAEADSKAWVSELMRCIKRRAPEQVDFPLPPETGNPDTAKDEVALFEDEGPNERVRPVSAADFLKPDDTSEDVGTDEQEGVILSESL